MNVGYLGCSYIMYMDGVLMREIVNYSFVLVQMVMLDSLTVMLSQLTCQLIVMEGMLPVEPLIHLLLQLLEKSYLVSMSYLVTAQTIHCCMLH